LAFVLVLIISTFILSIDVLAQVKNEELTTFEVLDGYNSQNIDILDIRINNNSKIATGGGDILITDDVALVASSGYIGTIADVEQTKNIGKIFLYEVRDGDTLSQIADMYDVSMNTIRWANDMDGAIQPGCMVIMRLISVLL
jgi:hypothetical protein